MKSRPPLRSATREQLVLALTVAAELEHALACVYLFAAYSVADAEHGADPRGALLADWKKTLLGVGVEEMLHLAQVSNLLTAVGGVPHLQRPNFPQPAETLAMGVPLSLERFSRATLERLVRFELPSAEAEGERVYVDGPHDGIEPAIPAFATVGELYKKIAALIRAVPEPEMFIGPRAAQTEGEDVSFGKDLVQVTDRQTALLAIARIVDQGEGASSEGQSGHYARFSRILGALEEELARDPGFEPARPVAPNPVTRRRWDTRKLGTIIVDPHTHQVAELANFTYETLLLVLSRLFAHAGETGAELQALGALAVQLMTAVLGPMGEALTTLPLGDGTPRTAGLEFAVTRDIQLLPHKGPAFAVLAERLRRLSGHAGALSAEEPGLQAVSDALAGAAASFDPVARGAW